MELFSPLTAFYNAINGDARIGATHISLYMALLQQWNINGGINPINVVRYSVMIVAKINSRQTYNKCINDLCLYGYIDYQPSSNQFKPSIVYLKNLA